MSNPVRLGFTGLGSRGGSLLESCLSMSDVEIAAICNRSDERREQILARVADAGRPSPSTFTDHGTMLSAANLDGVVISTPWTDHVPMAIEALEAGVYVGLEVGAASSVEECWELVHTAERTGTHCMFLENTCYFRDCLAIRNMIRAGLFGELVHCRCGYGHDLRSSLHRTDASGESLAWRGRQNRHRNADLYPTHGVGPMAKVLDVNRGNRFVSLTATATKSAGLAAYAEENLDPDHPAAGIDWAIGDVITTVLRCANGETLTVTHDVSLPRPYSNMFHVQGTGGIWKRTFESLSGGEVKTESAIYLEEESPGHEWEDFAPYQTGHEHSVWEAYLEAGVKNGHGGIDYLTLRDYVRHVKRDARPPIDVYDAAAWMAVTPLTEDSIALGGEPVSVPDFTNGAWMTTEPPVGEPAHEMTADLDL